MDGLLMENPIKMDDLGVPPFQETSKYSFLYNPYPDFWWWESIFPLLPNHCEILDVRKSVETWTF